MVIWVLKIPNTYVLCTTFICRIIRCTVYWVHFLICKNGSNSINLQCAGTPVSLLNENNLFIANYYTNVIYFRWIDAKDVLKISQGIKQDRIIMQKRSTVSYEGIPWLGEDSHYTPCPGWWHQGEEDVHWQELRGIREDCSTGL